MGRRAVSLTSLALGGAEPAIPFYPLRRQRLRAVTGPTDRFDTMIVTTTPTIPEQAFSDYIGLMAD